MRNKVHLLLLVAWTLLASSCGTSYYSSSSFSDDLYLRPTTENRLAIIKEKEQQYIDDHAMVNSYFQVDSATGRVYLKDGVSYTDLLQKFDNTTYNCTLSFGGWYDPWNPWFDPWYGPWRNRWYDPWYRPWYRPWHYSYRYGPWYDPWYSPWYGPGYYDPWYRPGIVVVNPGSRGVRTGSSSYGFGHRTDGGLRSTSTGTAHRGQTGYSSGTSTHRTPNTGKSSTGRSQSTHSYNSSNHRNSYSGSAGTYRGSGYSGGSGGGHAGGGHR